MTRQEAKLEQNWTTDNQGVPRMDREVRRYLRVRPSEAQLLQSQRPFYCFVHFGMNTATGREWGCGQETPADFDLREVHPEQWARAVKSAGAAGLILTCKHHDGFCLWNTAQTDFSVMHSALGQDIVALTAQACQKEGLAFGVYLSPWDMHEPSYGSTAYNDFFCAQLTELLTGYGPVFEVWFDGAKGRNAKDFSYDWDRYYQLVRRLQPQACMAVCGPDLRWVGNEAGKTRSSEFSVVPASLTQAEIVQALSQHGEEEAGRMQALLSGDEDLGSRQVLAQAEDLCWYPAEVDVSIRPGWFYHPQEDGAVKSEERLWELYLQSVGQNCSLLLNVPPARDGRIAPADLAALAGLGRRIEAMTAQPLLEAAPGRLLSGWLEFDFSQPQAVQFCVLEEDITKSQRVEAFDLYWKLPGGALSPACSGTVIGARRVIPAQGVEAAGAVLVVRQSRGRPWLKQAGFYG